MNKILLIYEDYAELMAVEGALKKVGFDVIGLSNEYSVAEQVLAFNPDLVVGSGRGGKVSALGVGKRLKDMSRWNGRSVLVFPANFKPDPQDLLKIRVDMVLEAPVAPFRLIQVIGRLLGHDESLLLERFNKGASAEPSLRPSTPVGGGTKFLTDSEAIVIRGSVSSGDGSSASANRPEKNFSLTPDIEGEEDRPKKFDFKFGDRTSSSSSSSAEAQFEEAIEKAVVGFADVDLKELEKELLGGGVPEIERVDLPLRPLTDDEEMAVVQNKMQEALKKSAESLGPRMAKYKKLVADLKVAPASTLTRVEARKRQNQLAADWDSENLKELDKLRQEFAKALFKK